MSGDPEAAAKKLALAIAIIAQSEKRPLCVVNYSFTVSFFMLTDFQRQKKSFLTFCLIRTQGEMMRIAYSGLYSLYCLRLRNIGNLLKIFGAPTC